ncbi:hypothetical protein MXL46_04560 [Heyndrickxia sporothermodurans]|uniref:Uncharacterized protein n=1 Tax=Clostridium aciditolerans TaxID=339861 RepID=A0A934HZG4_9CLOT|nr:MULTISPECIES: hypothetical protein [Bacillota]MBI6873347.1 hypothetical protein [Clostridium aciditolerans]MEB6548381.1 hypothetical protein [Heyndrickxia sporothermodurans]
MLLLWYASFLASIFTLIFGLFKRSGLFMLISTITFIPIAYYFLGAENAWKYVGFTPVILLILTIYFWFSGRKTEAL